jgi:hypothetical protein
MNKLAVNIGQAYNSPFGQTKSFSDLVSLIITGGITIAGVIALFLFVLGGISMISSAGSSDPQGAAKGKTAVTMGVAGFIIVVMAYFVIKVLETITGNTFLTGPFTSNTVLIAPTI